MNPMYLIYVPVAVFFVAFVIYAGLVMPAREVVDSIKDRNRPRGPSDADVIELPQPKSERKVAA